MKQNRGDKWVGAKSRNNVDHVFLLQSNFYAKKCRKCTKQCHHGEQRRQIDDEKLTQWLNTNSQQIYKTIKRHAYHCNCG